MTQGAPPPASKRIVPLPTFQSSAPAALADEQLRANLRMATRGIREKRARVVGEVAEWEALREAGRSVKEEVLGNLDRYLSLLSERVTAAGGMVHRAFDAAEANRIVGDLVAGAGARGVVKVKSITTEEIGLNRALEARGIRPLETDLAELIVQLAGDRSSHFLVPAIHKNRTQIRDLFRDRLCLPHLSDRPAELAEAARLHLRQQFLAAQVAVSGANFAVAETGTVGVVESEGNGRMCLTLPRVLITVMGVEKVLPRFVDLSVFLQVLPRSATGERMNPYTSLWTGVTAGDGPQEFHLVLLDNGRTRVLADPVGRQALHCIRCSACLNTCPVYERVGGHAYNATYPGPIGSILVPQLLGPGVHDSLPFASTLCGACAEVCPVKIDIPRVLLHLRGRVAEGTGPGKKGGSLQERGLMQASAWLFSRPRAYAWALAAARFLLRPVARDGWIRRLPGLGAGWTRGRDFPMVARQTFREWWKDQVTDPGSGSGSNGHPAKQDRPEREEGGRRDPLPQALDRWSVLDLFVERVSDYNASVVRVPEPNLPHAIAGAVRGSGVRSLAVPQDLPKQWIDAARVEGVDVTPDEGSLGKDRLATTEGVLTGCAAAMAETGTVILDGGARQGRRLLSLLPDCHICVVYDSQVVETVDQGIEAVAPAVRDRGAPLTLISGPSATSDIELNRVEGVHGPRTLYVILVESA